MTTDRRDRPAPTPSSAASTATVANQTSGPVSAAENTVNSAMPLIDPMMSMPYALSGGMAVSSAPSGTARPAMIIVVMMTRPGRTKKLMSAPWLSLSPKKISSGEVSSIVTRNWVTRTTRASSNGPNGDTRIRFGSRPHRIPTPIPRNAAMSRRLRKNPT